MVYYLLIFYLPQLNLLIEYDGIQHFKCVDYFGGEIGLKKIKKNDLIKNNYCMVKNIKLLRIKYVNFNEIEEIFKNYGII